MAEITAAAVKKLRDRTSLPMMECKQALVEAQGDEEKAVELLRLKGNTKMGAREAERVTEAGRVVCYASVDAGVGAMMEIQCESDPVATSEAFKQLCDDLVMQLAKGPGAATIEELYEQPNPSNPAQTLGDAKADLTNKMREVVRVPRLVRIDAPCGCYAHYTGTDGVLVEVTGGPQQTANEIAMHVAAIKPQVVRREELPAEDVAREKALQKDMALKEGKPESIVEKMIEGRMRNFYAERTLLDQPFVKDEKGKTTVGEVAKQSKMEIKRFVHWRLGKSGVEA